MKVLKKFYLVLMNSTIAFSDDNCFKLSASLSYYTIFAMAPLLLMIMSLAGVVYGNDAVSGRIYTDIQGVVGKEAALQIQELIANVQHTHATTAGAILGGIILFVGATGVFTEIQGSINFIWSVKAKPKRGWRKYLINRLISFSLVVGLGLLLLISLILNTVIALISTKLEKFIPNSPVFFIHSVNTIAVLVILTGLFMVIFKILPDAFISWIDALVGSAFTTILFYLGNYLIGVYFRKANLGVTYGTAASIVIILTWVYYSSLILYYGAEFTKIFALYSGHGIKPKQTAVFLIKSEAKEIPQSRLVI